MSDAAGRLDRTWARLVVPVPDVSLPATLRPSHAPLEGSRAAALGLPAPPGAP